MNDDGKLRVVLLLGAGASTCYECPTINQFCDRLVEIELALREKVNDKVESNISVC